MQNLQNVKRNEMPRVTFARNPFITSETALAAKQLVGLSPKKNGELNGKPEM